MRKIIAALQTSLDGRIEGPNGELDWIEGWDDGFGVMDEIDTCILGGGMYPGYEQYWTSILSNPDGVLEFTGRPATDGEKAYAAFADRTPHLVVSTTLKNVNWSVAALVRDLEEIRQAKAGPGRAMHLVGGAGLVASMINAGLVDELRLLVHPLVLGPGKGLFDSVSHRHALKFVRSKALDGGRMLNVYALAAG
ncbi:MAG: dihydrofolate reductase family protein [Rhizobiaceae bacterium]